MLSVLLGSAFIARQLWGAVADRLGGLKTLLWSSLAQLCAFGVRRDPGRTRSVCNLFSFWIRVLGPFARLRHHCSRLLCGERSQLAGPNRFVSRLRRNGSRRLGGRGPLRPFWFLRARVCGGHFVQLTQLDCPWGALFRDNLASKAGSA